MTRHLTAIFEQVLRFYDQANPRFSSLLALLQSQNREFWQVLLLMRLERVEVSKISQASSPQACRLHRAAKKVLRVVVFGLDSSSLSALKEDPYSYLLLTPYLPSLLVIVMYILHMEYLLLEF